jgi:hypothetical protein
MTHRIKFGPQNLSELVGAQDGETGSYYGVVVDKFCSNRLNGADRISFLAALDDPDQISFDVIDTLIQYRQAKANVLLEIPFDFPLSAQHVLVLANSISAGIVIAPPAEKTPENWEIWGSQVKDYARALFQVVGFSSEILPVTSYVQYMAMKVMGYTPSTLTDDVMMHRYFEQDMDIAMMDSLKSEMHAIILEGNGGADQFEVLVQSTLSAINDSVTAEGKQRLDTLTACLLGADAVEMEIFVLEILASLGHADTASMVVDRIVSVMIEHKDPSEFEQSLMNETADASAEEISAIEAFVGFVKTVLQ